MCAVTEILLTTFFNSSAKTLDGVVTIFINYDHFFVLHCDVSCLRCKQQQILILCQLELGEWSGPGRALDWVVIF